MAKRTHKDERPKWYTATVEPEAMPGNPSSQSGEVRATNKEEVEALLKAKGWRWKRLTISEGQCIYRPAWNWDDHAERYQAELEAMLEKRFPPRYNSAPVYIGSNAPAEVRDQSAREHWARYVEEWSHGISVSIVPHYLKVPRCGDIYLPALWVQDPALWDQCTGIVQRTVKQWKANRVHMAEHYKGERSPEARELQAECLADVATLKALEGWTFSAFMERLNLGPAPSPFDVAHPGILDIVTGHMVPSQNPGRDYVKVEWWRQLLTAWDGPANTKGARVEELLDHHHHHGGRAEVFRALVKSTARRLQAMKGTGRKGAEYWETLADALEQWLAKAPNVPKPEKGTTSAKNKLQRPTLGDKLGKVPGAAERFMAKVVRAGLCDASGAWIAGNDTKGKGKLIAIWDAVVEVLEVPNFDTDTALVKALKGHFKELEGLERLDKVRKRYSYAERVEEYIADLRETK